MGSSLACFQRVLVIYLASQRICLQFLDIPNFRILNYVILIHYQREGLKVGWCLAETVEMIVVDIDFITVVTREEKHVPKDIPWWHARNPSPTPRVEPQYVSHSDNICPVMIVCP